MQFTKDVGHAGGDLANVCGKPCEHTNTAASTLQVAQIVHKWLLRKGEFFTIRINLIVRALQIRGYFKLAFLIAHVVACLEYAIGGIVEPGKMLPPAVAS